MAGARTGARTGPRPSRIQKPHSSGCAVCGDRQAKSGVAVSDLPAAGFAVGLRDAGHRVVLSLASTVTTFPPPRRTAFRGEHDAGHPLRQIQPHYLPDPVSRRAAGSRGRWSCVLLLRAQCVAGVDPDGERGRALHVQRGQRGLPGGHRAGTGDLSRGRSQAARLADELHPAAQRRGLRVRGSEQAAAARGECGAGAAACGAAGPGLAGAVESIRRTGPVRQGGSAAAGRPAQPRP